MSTGITLIIKFENNSQADMFVPLPDEHDLMPYQIELFQLSDNVETPITTRQTAGCVQQQRTKLKRYYSSITVPPGQTYNIVLKLYTILIEPLAKGNYKIIIDAPHGDYLVNFSL